MFLTFWMVDHGGSLGILQPLQWQLRCWAPNCWKDALRRVPSRWQGVPKRVHELIPLVSYCRSCNRHVMCTRMGPSRTIAPKKQYGHVLRWLDDGYCRTCSLKACFKKWCGSLYKLLIKGFKDDAVTYGPTRRVSNIVGGPQWQGERFLVPIL